MANNTPPNQKKKPALSAALRANLAKRKAQARALENGEPPSETQQKDEG